MVHVDNSTIALEARDFAVLAHNRTGCTYDGAPYEIHLQEVVSEFHTYSGLLEETIRSSIESACWLHDVIEDCRVNWNDLVDPFGEFISDIVYNVTNELGKNRKERAIKTYPKIAQCEFSIFVKLCDRLANTKRSLANKSKSSMYRKYKAEYAYFRDKLKREGMWESMWAELDNLYEYEVVA